MDYEFERKGTCAAIVSPRAGYCDIQIFTLAEPHRDGVE